MKPTFLFAALAVCATFCCSNSRAVRAADAPRVFYAGGAGSEQIKSMIELPDRTVLVAGSADDLNWLPKGTPISTLEAVGIHNAMGGGRVGFLMQLSSDLGSVKRVVALPKGMAQDVSKIKISGANLYISGTTQDSKSAGGGYFIARLNGNFAGGAPTRALWIYNVWATGDHQSVQPWDVGSDGKVVFVTGQPFGADWCAVHRLSIGGAREVVPQWRTHWTLEGKEVRGAASQFTGLSYSAIVFKPKGRADLRSWTSDEYNAITPDGNGGTRKGSWPLDLFFKSPADLNNLGGTSSGPGYTGYNLGRAATARVVGVAIDPKDNSMYLGFSVQSKLPDGKPDFEPGVVAYTKDGKLKWWSRLYTETPRNSTPDQYVDGLAIDPNGGNLVVLARAHGNNTYNLWNGQSSFHDKFTGTNGNIHISWLGKLSLKAGALQSATYVAEYADDMKNTGTPYNDPNLDGWPDHNAGWPQLNTTKCSGDVRVDGSGNVYVAGVGRRTVTTANAFQKMLKKTEGASAWNSWARVYSSDFKSVLYSSLLTGQWDKASGAGGDNTILACAVPTSGGVLTAGTSKVGGNAMPTLNVPAWGAAQPNSSDAILARLPFVKPTTSAPAALVAPPKVEPVGSGGEL